MNSRQLPMYLFIHSPIFFLIGILCTVVYSLEFENSARVDWPISGLVCVVLVAVSIFRDNRNQRKHEDPSIRDTGRQNRSE